MRDAVEHPTSIGEASKREVCKKPNNNISGQCKAKATAIVSD